LAIALAAQKTLSNIFGAITVLLTKPFKLGDYVRID
jgi:small-conductance mechanosensitive channel